MKDDYDGDSVSFEEYMCEWHDKDLQIKGLKWACGHRNSGCNLS